MAIFSNRGTTPMDEREQALNAEIERLEREIALLKDRPDKVRKPRLEGATPSVASTDALPVASASPVPSSISPGASAETPVPPVPLPPSSTAASPASPSGARAKSGTGGVAWSGPTIQDPRYNELGERKFDVGQWWQGLLGRFHRDVVRSNNPEMVKYLATGSVHGLRPLRFERRIARNRTLGLVAILLVVLYGLAWVFLRR